MKEIETRLFIYEYSKRQYDALRQDVISFLDSIGIKDRTEERLSKEVIGDLLIVELFCEASDALDVCSVIDIVSSDKNEISYFFQEFKIDSKCKSRENFFVFPYAGMILDSLISAGNKNANQFLNEAIKHNRKVLYKLEKLSADNKEEFKAFYKEGGSELLSQVIKELERTIWNDLTIDEKDGVVFYRTQPTINGNIHELLSNLITVSEVSINPETKSLSDELNSIYDSILSNKYRKEH